MLLSSCVPAIAETHEQCFERRTNELRRQRKRVDLIVSSRVRAVAERHSRKMAARGTIFHNDGQPPDDSRSIGDELEPYRWVGENVGMGPGCGPIFDAFLGSPEHKANLIDRDYEFVGAGVTVRGDTMYVSLSFFTPPRRVVAPSKPRQRPPPPRPRPSPRCR